MGNIIDSLCMTWRHDYGLYKADDDDSISSGMTTAERESLRRKMTQLHAHHIAPLEARIAELERASQPGSGEAVKVDAVRANFTPFFIMSNVRRIVPAYYNNQRANWVLAMDVFAVGSKSARQICLDAGIDPDGCSVIRVSTGEAARASLDGRREG